MTLCVYLANILQLEVHYVSSAVHCCIWMLEKVKLHYG